MIPWRTITIGHHGYDPSYARIVENVVKSFMRLNYSGERYKINTDAKRGVLEFPLRNPEDITALIGTIYRVKSLKGRRVTHERV